MFFLIIQLNRIYDTLSFSQFSVLHISHEILQQGSSIVIFFCFIN